ncbi:mycothiol conjugate amidase Mca [Herbiconiux sp. VKM Ac-1786]|uniref:mycothiol conjugate amidase Mca n=1 Tax=Herbiconiux sp. VKM Ac-1786 TaxID=2783824 RepID=UPI00188BF30A|nr:mycothiol conjugate amidase Mca [Herbiconiux sp. VKM Ac-1786]MBF4574035.1 mycothiol conjugate amidase Mca [Herbiconiux sp. VKM Ac-1786]
MAVHAHPDDESSKGAATYAYYLDRGVEVMVVSCTGGERGSVLNEGLEPRLWAERDMAGLRRVEMAAAQDAVGFQHRWLGYADSGYVEPGSGDSLPVNSFGVLPIDIETAPLVKAVREFRPHVLITYDEIGGYPHADHIRCHEISMRAWELAGDPAAYPEAGPAWQISKLYYDRIMNPDKFEAVAKALEEEEPEHPFLAQVAEMRERMKDRPSYTVVQIPSGDFFDVRDRALRAHASQVAPDHPFFFWPNDIQRRAWPYEDFQLIESRVAGPEVETDLFDGIEDSE